MVAALKSFYEYHQEQLCLKTRYQSNQMNRAGTLGRRSRGSVVDFVTSRRIGSCVGLGVFALLLFGVLRLAPWDFTTIAGGGAGSLPLLGPILASILGGGSSSVDILKALVRR